MVNTEVYELEENMPRVAATPAATADWRWQRWDEWAGTSCHPRKPIVLPAALCKGTPHTMGMNQYHDEEGGSE